MVFDRKLYQRTRAQRPDVKRKKAIYEKIRAQRPDVKQHNRDYMRNWCRRNRPKRNEIRRKERLRYKKRVIAYYSYGQMCCMDCKENILDLLTIDHVNGGGKKHAKIHKNDLYRWLISRNFPLGYAVLCIRCNWLKGKVSKERYEEIINLINTRH